MRTRKPIRSDVNSRLTTLWVVVVDLDSVFKFLHLTHNDDHHHPHR